MRLVLPLAMFGVAVSFFTLIAAGRSDDLVLPYAATMAVLTFVNLVWERVRASRPR